MAIVRPQGGGTTLVVFVAVFIPLCIASTILRIWARRVKKKQLEVNDFAVVVATVRVTPSVLKAIPLTSISSGLIGPRSRQCFSHAVWYGVYVTVYAITKTSLTAVVNGGVGYHQLEVLTELQTLQKVSSIALTEAHGLIIFITLGHTSFGLGLDFGEHRSQDLHLASLHYYLPRSKISMGCIWSDCSECRLCDHELSPGLARLSSSGLQLGQNNSWYLLDPGCSFPSIGLHQYEH